MKIRPRHHPRLEPLESRLQPSLALLGIPALPSPGTDLPGPETDRDADAALVLIRRRRLLDMDAAPPRATSSAHAAGVIGGAPWQPPQRPAPPTVAGASPPRVLLPPAAHPPAPGHAVRPVLQPATGATLGVAATANPLPTYLTPVEPRVILRHTPPVPGSRSDLYVSYGPAVNSDGPSESQAVAATKEGTAFVTGWTVDANGQQDLFVERTTLAGDVTSALLVAPDGGSWSGHGIVVTGSDSGGTVYVVGDAVAPGSGAASVLVAGLNAADLTVNAAVMLSGAYGDVNGRAVSLDSHGNPVLVGQAVNAAGSRDMAGYRLDAGLAHVLSSVSLHLAGPGDSGCRAVAVDADDQVYVSGTWDSRATNTEGVDLRLSADLQSIVWGYSWHNAAEGRNGAVNGITIAGGFLYLTGFLAGNSGTPESHDLLLAKVRTADGLPEPGGYSRRWQIGTLEQSTGDFGGHAIAVDDAGRAFVAADINGPPDDAGTLDINGQLVAFAPAGDQIVGAVTYGNQVPGTMTTDRDYGVALQSTTPGDNVFSAGWTESDETTAGFPVTANAARPVLASAGHDGWDAAAAQPLPAYP